MNSIPTISGWHMKATLDFLNLESPDLSHHILAIGRQSQIEQGNSNRGETVFVQYPLILRTEDATAICEALEMGLRKFSEDQLFCEVRLGSLIELWKGYAAILRDEI